jgi:hypothetical protein
MKRQSVIGSTQHPKGNNVHIIVQLQTEFAVSKQKTYDQLTSKCKELSSPINGNDLSRLTKDEPMAYGDYCSGQSKETSSI